MNESKTSSALTLGVNSVEGLKLFVPRSITRYTKHADYFGFSLEDTTVIEITVGQQDEKVSWILPKSLLTHHSKFFNAALNRTFAESNSRSMTMPEDNPEAFRLFVQCLYVGDIKTGDVQAWIEAWILGDKIGITAFRDRAMMKLIYHHTHWTLVCTTVGTAYRRSVLGSKIREWALEEFRFQSSEGGLYFHAGNWASVVETVTEFTADVTKAMVLGDEIKSPVDDLNLNSYFGE